MTAGDRKLAAGVSVLATVSVALNMAAFQNQNPKGGVETGAIARQAWGEGPGLVLDATASSASAPAGPGPIAPAPTAPRSATLGPVTPSSQNDTSNSAEFTRGIQRELCARGYLTGQPDGVPGLVTRAAIFAYEYDNGLVLTGRPSEPLLSQIVLGSSSLAGDSARPGRTISPDGEALVRGVKQQLSALGYQTGAPGGTLTPEFARSIREFELDQKLTETGRISSPMVSRLIRVQGDAKARRAAAEHKTSR